MMYTSSPEELKQIINGKKDEIAQATRTARECMDRIIAFCYPPETTDMIELPDDPTQRNIVLGRDYLFDLLSAYVEGAPNREKRMRIFAENYQRGYEDIKEILDFLGLEI